MKSTQDVLCLVAASILGAAAVILTLAAPGLLSDASSTVPPRLSHLTQEAAR